MKTLLLIPVLIFFSEVKAQTKIKVDSLEVVLKKSKEDTSKIMTLILLANEIRYSNPEKSIQYCLQALQISSNLNFSSGVAQANITIGVAKYNLGLNDEALKYLLQGLETSKNINDNQTASHALNNIGLVYTVKGAYPGALKCYNEAIKLSGRTDKKEIANCYANIGMTNEKQGNYDEAAKFQSIALKIRNEIGDRQGIAASLNFKGTIYKRQGDYSAAMQNHLAALKIQEETRDELGMVSSLKNIGIIYILQSNYSEAMKNLTASLKIAEAIKNKNGIGDAYGNMGWCYANEGKYEESLTSTLAALEIFKEIGDRQNMALYHNNAGLIYSRQGNYAEVMKNLLVAVQLFEEIGDKANMAETYESIGEAYSSAGKYSEAIAWLNKSLNAATEISEKKITKECYRALAIVYEKLNDYKNAYKFHTLYTDIKERIDEESSRKVAEMKSKYETDKKQSEIELLKKDKQVQAGEIKRQTIIKNSILAGVGITGIFTFFLFRSFTLRRKISFEKQTSEVEMKALRAQMNPHFIFNALRSINEYIQNNKSSLASEYLIKFAKLMRAILENSRQKDIVLSKEIEVLEMYMQLESQRMEYPFKYTFEIDTQIDAANTLMPPMLLQPIVENSIWHGLAPNNRPGKIIVRIKRQDEAIQCEVEDDGIGRVVSRNMNKENLSKPASYGLKITEERLAIIEQIKKIKTNLTFRDLDGTEGATGLIVSFNLPYEEVV